MFDLISNIIHNHWKSQPLFTRRDSHLNLLHSNVVLVSCFAWNQR